MLQLSKDRTHFKRLSRREESIRWSIERWVQQVIAATEGQLPFQELLDLGPQDEFLQSITYTPALTPLPGISDEARRRAQEIMRRFTARSINGAEGACVIL